MTDVLADVADKIRGELSSISEEIERLESALNLLGEEPKAGGSRAKSPRAATKPKPRSSSGRKRARRGQRQAELLGAIDKQPGRRPSEYAKELGIPDSQVHALLKKLIAEQKIVRNVKDGIQPIPF